MSLSPLRSRAFVLCALPLASALSFAAETPVGSAALTSPGAVPAHHVTLTGAGGNEETARRYLRDSHEICVGANKLNGRPWRPLPTELPVIAPIFHVDIYYADNRAMTVTSGEVKYVERSDCTLQTRRWKHAKLLSMAGGCEIDLVQNKKRGMCDAALHAAAAPRPPLRGMGGRVRSPDVKTVAGETCHVYRLESMHSEHCIAELAPGEGRTFSPASAYPAYDNGGLHGVLLEVNAPNIMKLQATMVNFNILVPASVFSAEFTGPTGP